MPASPLLPGLVIIGGGPAGLMAAESAARRPAWTSISTTRWASVGRKFLIAGKGGLNLTHGEASRRFVRATARARNK